MSSWRVLSAFLGSLFLVTFAGVAPGLAQTTPATLTATPAAITVTVLAHHTVPKISVAVTASDTVSSSDQLGATVLGDLVRDDSAARVPGSALNASVAADTNDKTGKTFILSLQPDLSGIDPGKYSGNVQVEGPGVNPLVVPVTLNIQGGSWWGALVLLLIGLGVGWLLKWYADAGSKLAAETRRYNAVLRKIGPMDAENMPRFVLNELGDVTQGFHDNDQAAVDAALTLLEGQVAGLAAVTDAARNLREVIHAHETEIAQQGLVLPNIPTYERSRLNNALGEATDLAGAKGALADLVNHAIAITTCLQSANGGTHAAVLAEYNQGLFDQALNAFTNPPAPAPAAAGAAVAAPAGTAADPARLQSLLDASTQVKQALAVPAGPVAGQPVPQGGAAKQARWTKEWASNVWSRFLGRWLPIIIGVITVVVIALIGLKSQWSSNVTFGSGGVVDDVALFLWGVAAFVTGKTLSDFLSTVVSQ